MTMQLTLNLDGPLATLDEFDHVKDPKAQQPPSHVKTKPRAPTLTGLQELERSTSLAEFKTMKGYMSRQQYRIFSQCERAKR